MNNTGINYILSFMCEFPYRQCKLTVLINHLEFHKYSHTCMYKTFIEE